MGRGHIVAASHTACSYELAWLVTNSGNSKFVAVDTVPVLHAVAAQKPPNTIQILSMHLLPIKLI